MQEARREREKSGAGNRGLGDRGYHKSEVVMCQNQKLLKPIVARPFNRVVGCSSRAKNWSSGGHNVLDPKGTPGHLERAQEQIPEKKLKEMIELGDDSSLEKTSVEQVLKNMEKQLGAEPRPMVLMAGIVPDAVLRQASDRKFVFDLPAVPAKYKHLISVAVAAAVSSHLCTETFIRLAERTGVSKEEIAEAILTAKFALGSTVFASAVEGMELLTKGEK